MSDECEKRAFGSHDSDDSDTFSEVDDAERYVGNFDTLLDQTDFGQDTGVRTR